MGRRDGGARPSPLQFALDRGTKPGADLARLDEGTARGFAAWLCERHGVTQAILTDGTQWTVHQEGRALAPPPVDLLAALDESRAFESFLWHFLSEAS